MRKREGTETPCSTIERFKYLFKKKIHIGLVPPTEKVSKYFRYSFEPVGETEAWFENFTKDSYLPPKNFRNNFRTKSDPSAFSVTPTLSSSTIDPKDTATNFLLNLVSNWLNRRWKSTLNTHYGQLGDAPARNVT
ncbi:hypothetical protein PGT21_029394 [Puccinia graminis f. sp. tritici]|uniref:Uncharacterized protein n=1 Tax=Puccinia graminis f. sp. tritici TaxID=56615 RepID=A0A5B0NQM6_PUCGR|nr:hypothetical protein PGT21_029394 [Puccinia graminis f. sp. tritici]